MLFIIKPILFLLILISSIIVIWKISSAIFSEEDHLKLRNSVLSGLNTFFLTLFSCIYYDISKHPLDWAIPPLKPIVFVIFFSFAIGGLVTVSTYFYSLGFGSLFKSGLSSFIDIHENIKKPRK